MKAKWLQIAFLCVVLGWAWVARGDNNWDGSGQDGLWSNPENWSMGVVPATGQGNYVLNAQTYGSLITADASVAATVNGDVFGPEWGLDLTIDGGSITQAAPGFVFAPIGGDEAGRTVITVQNGGYLEVVNLLLGDNWWFVRPYVTLNVYDTGTVKVTDWVRLGGHMNLYGGTVDIDGGFNMALFDHETAIPYIGQGLTKLDIEKGQLIIRGGDYTTNVADWIANGYLTAYGTVPGQPGNATVVVDTTTIPGGTIITAQPSLAARNPNPTPLNATGSVGTLVSNTEVELTLNWDAGPDPNELRGLPFNPDILTHYVTLSAGGVDYEWTVPQVSTTDPAVSLGPITLPENTECIWSVEEGVDDGTGMAYPSGDPNNILGPVWTFRTKAATPTILTNPASAIANPDASFAVTADDVAMAYQWYKVGNPDTALADGGVYAGTQTATLTITNASVADEGLYYCRAINGPNFADSAAARLWTARLIGHWKFDGDLLDSVTPAHDGVIAGDGPGDADYGTGIDGGAMEFFNDGDFVEIADPEYFNFYPLGFTASFWYKEKSSVGWRLPVSKVDAGAAGWLCGVDSGFRNQAVAFFESQNDAALWADGSDQVNVGDGQWHLVTITYDPAATNLTIYTDGDENENVTVDISDLAANPLPAAALAIGGWAGNLSVDGFIDDVRIYSKPLTPTEVAQLYVAFEPAAWICVEDEANPLGGFDADGDCRVTLSDVALLAGRWLECQRYPQEACID